MKQRCDSYEEAFCVNQRKEYKVILDCEHLGLLSQPTVSCSVRPGRRPKLYHVMLWALNANDLGKAGI